MTEPYSRNFLKSFAITSIIAIVFFMLGWSDLQALNFQAQWPTVNGTITSVTEPDPESYRKQTLWIEYRYQLEGADYYGFFTRQQYGSNAAQYREHAPIRLWYHPLFKMISFPFPVHPLYDIAFLCISAFLAFVSLETLVQFVREYRFEHS